MVRARTLILFPLFFVFIGAAISTVRSEPVAEPNFAEHEICKTFGRGYIRLPGSKNCLKISGFVRVQFEQNIDDETMKRENKGVFAIKVKSDTDKGRLRSKLSFEATGDAAKSVLELKPADATISLDKWLIGYTASNWVRYEWGGFNIKSGPFGYHKAQMLRFEDTFQGIKLRLALEFPEDIELDFPTAIAHVSRRGKWGSAFVSGVIGDVDKGSVGVVKTGFVLKLNKIKKGVRLKFQGTFGRDATDKYLEGDDWDFIAAYSHPLARKLTANFTFGSSDSFRRNHSWAGNLVWKPARGLKVVGEVRYVDNTGWGGLLRIERRF